ncbi:valine--tRNA ligase [Candidatus Berkelbacteria bacterium CG10_big_fil_rev_8_21_14_0_10_43_13]|uniref:Valine--tRNA ligase n=1 Tax=Candidatus Berkelbacteria bacterium CG10_big_fil_rev_8_21_14_0_10_43_13 TaxID=1974514 RepID=A0A2H0W7M0_9BACT|nr:MAG: valine--tRNA ligase [Candidatus Berkelbacteria bacterium CG10_big_fil_rev_8_21_14_0_10_43_13]
MKEISKTYDHEKVEKALYAKWEKAGYFKPEINPDGEPFTIIMPPPNANGSLHVGHAVFVTLEDIMTRYARLQGKAALWLPGADHAGFETQSVFEKKLEKEGRSRFKMPREQLYEETLKFTLENKEIMEGQLRRLGASCDWSREKFTLDPAIIKIIYKTFVKLYEDGLAYRDVRPVNWCTKHQTSLSELEVKYEEQTDPLYYIKYKVESRKSEVESHIIVATVRPETIFGDTAIAVNPNDKRFVELVGSRAQIPLTDIEIPIIADDMVDPKFGTGVVKITPAHDPNDFEAGRRHNLETREVIDQYGRLNDKTGPFAGLKILESRRQVVEAMEKKGLIEKIDQNYVHSVGKCYKCGTVIEPRILPQWFIAMDKKGKKSGKNLAKDAITVVKNKEVSFVTPKFEKIFNHWMKNIRDWNISRQIVWGIRLPVWYKKSKFVISNEVEKSQGRQDPRALLEPPTGGLAMAQDDKSVYVGIEPPKDIENWEQDADVFDTWFSSGQWPFAALKAEETRNKKQETNDFDKFYPTAVMETGWDILFFWVARMIMLGIYITDEVPFKNVYLHGLVRDKDRMKMSKSKGNVINPLGVSDEYGADAVRMALVFGTSAGNDAVISEEKIRGMRNFSNKIWNASRFVILRVTEGDLQTGQIGAIRTDDLTIDSKDLTAADKKIIQSHTEIIEYVSHKLDKYQFNQAGEDLYEYFWHTFCDDYIEIAKTQLDDDKTAETTKKILIKILSESLVLLHPFMPFVTEAVWQELRQVYTKLPDSVMIAKWPRK